MPSVAAWRFNSSGLSFSVARSSSCSCHYVSTLFTHLLFLANSEDDDFSRFLLASTSLQNLLVLLTVLARLLPVGDADLRCLNVIAVPFAS